MATFKVLLDKRRQLKDGDYPLIIRIFSEGTHRNVGLKIRLKEDEFDEATQRAVKHPNKKEINQKITQNLVKFQESALKMELADTQGSAQNIKTSVVKPQIKLDFLAFAETIVREQEDGKHYGNALFYKSSISALKTYTGKDTILFREVTYEFLKKLENKMLTKGLAVNGVAMYMRTIRAVYNKAIKSKLIDRSNYPYDSFKIKMEATAKRNISKVDIQAIMGLKLEIDSPAWHARNYFLLCFNLIGISFADLLTLRKTDIANGRVTYRRKKTHKLYNIKLTKQAEEIIRIYYPSDSIYILPELHQSFIDSPATERKRISQAIKNTNKYLGRMGRELKIDQNLTTYVVRHSWATISKRLGYSKDLIAEALGHEFGNKVTGIYLDNFDQDVIDDMNEAVCNLK